MKTETTGNYARVLYELSLPAEAIACTRKIFRENPFLPEVFCNPVIQEKKKYRIIERIFPKEIQNFLKVVCAHRKMEYITGILEEQEAYSSRKKGVLRAVLTCAVPPGKAQQESMKEFLCRQYGAQQIELDIEQDDSLIGGFILSTGDEEYDWSLRGRLKGLEEKLTE